MHSFKFQVHKNLK